MSIGIFSGVLAGKNWPIYIVKLVNKKVTLTVLWGMAQIPLPTTDKLLLVAKLQLNQKLLGIYIYIAIH